MKLSQGSLETLIDLVEIKLSCMEVFDRDDAREIAGLEACLGELKGLAGRPEAEEATVMKFPKPKRGRRRVAQAAV